MIKEIPILLICLFSVAAFAKESKTINQVSYGYLQAYWFPQWSADGKAQSPYIMMRFFATDKANARTFYLYESKDKQGVKDDFDEHKTKKFIKDNFKNIPEEFFKYREGHVEQAGNLVYSNLTIIHECNSKQKYVKFVSFIPNQKQTGDVTQLESQSGCNAEPYTVMFTLKEGKEPVYLKSEPSVQSKNSSNKPVELPLVKIKTVNSEWVYVALYDASKPGSRSQATGYLKLSDLDVAN